MSTSLPPARISIDTNGGANTFTFDALTGNLTVSGQAINGSFDLTGAGANSTADNSVLLARLFGGVVLSNGDLQESAGRTALDSPFFQIKTQDAAIGTRYDVWGGNLNVAPVDSGDARIAAVVDFGPRFVGGSERIGFDSVADAENFVNFLNWAASHGALDNIM
jgi:hypothetical protein